jgi:hypothetical protein
MTTRTVPILGVALLATLLLGACGTVTKIPTTWRNPDYQGASFQKVLVIGVAERDADRRLFEDRFAEVLFGRGLDALPSYEILPQSERLSEEQIREAIAGGGHDAVIVTRLLGMEEKTEYVPPRSHTVPRYYHGYYGYYGRTWDVVHEPGYSVTRTIMRLETNLYEVGSGDLVWSGQSETFDPRSLEESIDSVTEAVAEHLWAEGLIP